MKIGSLHGEIGKYKILLDQVSSTQDYALELLKNGSVRHGTVVSCSDQTQGKGRLEKSWQSARNQNLTASFILKRIPISEEITYGFINMIAAIAVDQTIQSFIVPKAWIKWPNDIICNERKLAGILITNQWRGFQIESTVLGIGINVNQLDFQDAPQAGSIRQFAATPVKTEEVLSELLRNLNQWYARLIAEDAATIRSTYYELLYGFHQFITVKINRDNTIRTAQIVEALSNGKIKLAFKDLSTEEFDLDEVKIYF